MPGGGQLPLRYRVACAVDDLAFPPGRRSARGYRRRDGRTRRETNTREVDHGHDVARQCPEEGVLDEIFVCIAPVLLRDGVRLFDHPGGRGVKLERLSVGAAPMATNIRLRVVY